MPQRFERYIYEAEVAGIVTFFLDSSRAVGIKFNNYSSTKHARKRQTDLRDKRGGLLKSIETGDVPRVISLVLSDSCGR